MAMAAAAAVPLLLPSLPPEARSIPLPPPVFCTVLAVQLVVLYGLLGFVGLRLARTRGFEPAPCLTAIWNPKANRWGRRRAGAAFAIGLSCGALLGVAAAAIHRLLPRARPGMRRPLRVAASVLASIAGPFGEEILFRLFALSLLLRLLPKGRAGTRAAIGVGALAFAAAPAPALMFQFGGWQEAPQMSCVWLIA